MSHFLPDPGLDGSFKFYLPNEAGKMGLIEIEAGASPKIKITSAGYGFEIRNAAGAVIFNVTETGGIVPPTVTAEPSPGAAPQIYIFGGVLKYFDGAVAAPIVTA